MLAERKRVVGVFASPDKQTLSWVTATKQALLSKVNPCNMYV
jgi:hypothetical protein